MELVPFLLIRNYRLEKAHIERNRNGIIEEGFQRYKDIDMRDQGWLVETWL